MPDGAVFEPPQYSLNQLPPVRLHLVSPGGGGLGDPYRRPVEAVQLDVRDGVVSREAARAHYGVVLSEDGDTVDMPATAHLRSTT